MQYEFRQSLWSDVAIHAIGAAMVLVGALGVAIGQAAGWGAIILGLAASGLAAWIRLKDDVYLIIDQGGVRSPAMQIEIAWDNIRSVSVFYPSRGMEEGIPALAFDVFGESRTGPGAQEPEMLKRLMQVSGAPRIYIKLPLLDAPISAVIRALERAAPTGKVGPPIYHDARDGFRRSRNP